MGNIIKKIIVILINLGTIYKLGRKSPKKRILVLCVPQYINYGDLAIQIAEEKFLKQNFSEYEIVTVSIHFCIYMKKYLEPNIRYDDLLMFTGGGWLGDLWPFISDEANDIINRFSKNKIIFFPQTIYFKNNSNLLKTKSLFSKHTNLYICLRDKKSYDLVTKDLSVDSNKVFLIPDMVLLLNEQKRFAQDERKGILLCFRKDSERILEKRYKEYITQYFDKKHYTYNNISTAYYECPVILPSSLGKYLAKRKIRKIGNSQLIVTDRLHGMIFASITGTPCLAFDNLSGKVSGVYSWICNLEYIKLVKKGNESNIYNLLDDLLTIKTTMYDNSKIISEIEKIKKIIEL